MTNRKEQITDRTRIAAVIGGGVIGGGWAARFLLNGWKVHIFDSDSDAAPKILDVLENARASLPLLADTALPEEGQLVFCDTLEQAASGALWIQESVPERLLVKKKVFAALQNAADHNAIIASSTSGFTPTQLREGAAHPDQIIVAHPYNPVYLLPAVELVGGADNSYIQRAATLLAALGMKPVILRAEIDAHIGDRLLEAVWREALWLVRDGIATTQDIDQIITHGFGLRWAQMGLFETYRMAGGEAGMRHFLAQFGPALAWPWTKLMDVPDLDDALIDKIVSQSDEQSGHLSIQQLEQIRDRNLVGFLQLLKNHHWAAGQALKDWDDQRPYKAGNVAAQAPFCQHTARVLPSWIDYNGHMTEFRYLQVMSEASDILLATVGLDEAYVETGHSVYTVETHIRHLAEATLGEQIAVSTQIISADEKRVHLWHACVTDKGKEIATGEQMWLHVDMKAGCTTPFKPPLKENIAALAATHAHLPLPVGAGRSIGGR